MDVSSFLIELINKEPNFLNILPKYYQYFSIQTWVNTFTFLKNQKDPNFEAAFQDFIFYISSKSIEQIEVPLLTLLAEFLNIKNSTLLSKVTILKEVRKDTRKIKNLFDFRERAIEGLFHMTALENLDSICKLGLFCREAVFEKNIPFQDISDAGVQQHRGDIHDHVPLYFNPKNPMLYRLKYKTLVILEISPMILLEHKFFFTDGNAASEATTFYSDEQIENLSDFDWLNIFYTKNWNSREDGKRKSMAEVLIPYQIPMKYIYKIHCKSKQEKDILAILEKNNLNIQIETDNSEIFFPRHF